MVRSKKRKKNHAKALAQLRNRHKRFDKKTKLLSLDDNLIIREKRLHIFVILVLLVFGTYISVLYFGHQVVPNSDFPAFVSTGRAILSFKLPSSFKRLPGLGMLQIGLSYLVGGQHPVLTAGWLLNAILYPATLILLYLIGRQVIGKGAIWFAILAIINPLAVEWMRHPVAETTLIFFILLSIYFINRRSRWCYLFAAMTTVIRYEGAALILAAFVMDIVEARSWKLRFKATLYSVLAGIPMSLWLLGMYLTRKAGVTIATMPYIRYYGNKTSFGRCTGLMWDFSLKPLLTLAPENQDLVSLFGTIGKILLIVCLLTALIYMVYKRQWHVLPVVIFLACYYLVHALKHSMRPRYCLPAVWAILMMGCYGLRSIGLMVSDKKLIPRKIIITLQILVAAASLIWFVWILKYLPYTAAQSQRSTTLPYCAMATVTLVLAAYIFVYRARNISGNIAMAAAALLLIVPNQFALAGTVGNGSTNMEFKKLADWYIANANPNEKMVTSLPHVVNLYAPAHKKYFISPSRVTDKSPIEFVNNCYKRGITYVAWDSRIGLNPTNSYYKKWGIENMAMLSKPRSIRPFTFVDEIRVEYSRKRYIYIFRLEPLAKSQKD